LRDQFRIGQPDHLAIATGTSDDADAKQLAEFLENSNVFAFDRIRFPDMVAVALSSLDPTLALPRDKRSRRDRGAGRHHGPLKTNDNSDAD
jgi:hypothetical protein